MAEDSSRPKPNSTTSPFCSACGGPHDEPAWLYRHSNGSRRSYHRNRRHHTRLEISRLVALHSHSMGWRSRFDRGNALMNTVATLGHNLASPRDLTRDVLADLGRWLADTRVIEDEDKAREAARLAKRAQNIISDIDAERKTKVGPLNEQVALINDEYTTNRKNTHLNSS